MTSRAGTLSCDLSRRKEPGDKPPSDEVDADIAQKGDVKAEVANRLWENLVKRESTRPRRVSRVKTFSDKYPWLGPGIWLLNILYFVIQIAVAQVWRPSYSWLRNAISDLGNTSCGPLLCSPRHDWMNSEFFLLGFVMAAGSLLIYEEFTEREADERLAARIGFTCLAVAGFGAVLVGWFPENTVVLIHRIGAGLAIGVGTTGIFVLGIILKLPRLLRWYMRLLSPIALFALVLFAIHVYLGLGAGTIERIAAYPESIWLIVFGIYMSRNHYYSNRDVLFSPVETKSAIPPVVGGRYLE